jgi:hypothetical protein
MVVVPPWLSDVLLIVLISWVGLNKAHGGKMEKRLGSG